jgi:Arm DNA-binding domain
VTVGKLTAKQVENAGAGMHSDGEGLYLQVGSGGARSWVYRFMLNGKERYFGLGSAADMPLKRARELAGDARRLRAEGLDPIEQRRAQRTAAQVQAAKAVTFKDVATQFIASHEVA